MSKPDNKAPKSELLDMSDGVGIGVHAFRRPEPPPPPVPEPEPAPEPPAEQYPGEHQDLHPEPQAPPEPPPPPPPPARIDLHSKSVFARREAPVFSNHEAQRPAASPQQQAAYVARTASLGYGISPRHRPPTPSWRESPPEQVQADCQDMLDAVPHSQLTQCIGQLAHPDIAKCGGVGSVLTDTWIRMSVAPPPGDAASDAFGHVLDHNIPGLVRAQYQELQQKSAVLAQQASARERMRVLTAEVGGLQTELWSRGKPGLSKAAARDKHHRALECKAELSHLFSEAKLLAQQLQARNAVRFNRIGLRHAQVLEPQHLDEAFLARLEEALAQQPGFWRLVLSTEGDSPGHVLGIQSMKGFKFMDPNTGEFTVPGTRELGALARAHLLRLNYTHEFQQGSLDRYF